MLNWFLVLVAVILTQALVLHLRFHHSAKGYMLRAAGWIWRILTVAILTQTLLAGAIVELVSRFFPLNPLLLSGLVGALTVLLPSTFEYFFLYRKGSEKSPLANALRRRSLAVFYEFGGALRTRMEQDVSDWQTGESFKLTKQQMRRRIRQVYISHAIGIATKRGDPNFLCRDAGFSAEEKLYVLIAHLGRKGLMAELFEEPNLAWDGNERRRIEVLSLPIRPMPGLESRFYDDEALVKRIRHQLMPRRPELIEARIFLLVLFIFFVAAAAQVVQIRSFDFPVSFHGIEFSLVIRHGLTIAGVITITYWIIWVFVAFLRGNALRVNSLEKTVVSAFMKALDQSPLSSHHTSLRSPTLGPESREQPTP